MAKVIVKSLVQHTICENQMGVVTVDGDHSLGPHILLTGMIHNLVLQLSPSEVRAIANWAFAQGLSSEAARSR